MSKLKCHVFECMHNTKTNCNLSDVKIAGSDAMYKDDTYCESFMFRSDYEKKYKEELATLDKALFNDINCSSVNCLFNLNKKCDKQNVRISGDYISSYCDSFVYNK